MIESQGLWNSLLSEYNQAKKRNVTMNFENINKNLKTIRIFISSTFRDFHNERNLLVTKIFPRLREWCQNHGLHLVECDLRWGIPDYSSSEETLITCFEEIDKGRHECNNMNFFLGLIGDRFGWIPECGQISDETRLKYQWIEGSSVTLMEILHGIIRTLTPNALIMIRSQEFLEDLPNNFKSDFIETNSVPIVNLKLFKDFLMLKFRKNATLNFYNVEYDGIIHDKLLDKNRVTFKKLEEFAKYVENHFIKCIKNNFIPFIKSPISADNMDEVHEYMVDCLVKPNTIGNATFYKLFNHLKDLSVNLNRNSNSILILSGQAGMGKSTILAQCAKEIKKLANCDAFFHSFSCTSNSKFNSTVGDRLLRFLSIENHMDTQTIEERMETILKALKYGPKRKGKEIYYIFLDGIDEMSYDHSLQWIPDCTSATIVMVISSLIDPDKDSFYSLLTNSQKCINEFSIESMERHELLSMVNDYLDSFGKRLDSDQISKLMSFKNSNNPLWLISACEELRIHGDYSTLTKLILSLPPTIAELNEMIIKRLLRQDSKNILRTFLQLLVISKSGLWESLVKDMLATRLNYPETVSHCLWIDVKWQFKGFLLFEAQCLPLIKLRHRVIKESIEKELSMGNKFQISLHKEMALFYEKHLNNSSHMFLPDYIYHLVKSNSRNQLIRFMRTRRSWEIFRQSYIRGMIMLSMRCNNKTIHCSSKKEDELVMCNFCAHKSGELSIHTSNRNCCFFCGNVIFNNNIKTKLFSCQFHKQLSCQKKCSLCEGVTSSLGRVKLQVCQLCQVGNEFGKCGVLVKEEDILFDQQLEFSKAVYKIENFI